MARLRRKAKKSEDADLAENVDLSDREHAWWAARPRLTHTYGFDADTDAVADTREAPDPEPADQSSWQFRPIFQADGAGHIEQEPQHQYQHHHQHEHEHEHEQETRFDARDLAEIFGEESAYRALGIEPGAPWADVVTNHRRLAKLYHPDRLLDADPITRAEGETKMRDANVAYETLRRWSRETAGGAG